MTSPRHTRSRAAAAVASLALAFGGVELARATEESPTPVAPATDPAHAIAAAIGDAACDDDSQCKTIAVGTKACGGPEYFLAWSSKRTDAAALRQAADSALIGRRNMNANPGLRSNCAVVTDPGAYCAPATAAEGAAAGAQGGSCRLRNGGRGAGRVD